jgi:hypothetical protein|tara:strand:+ start:231 stop:665 length:435 start_codon:yes stop_codon:yes gene_type:complete
MATFTSQIFEILTLNGDNVGSSVTNTINDINYVDNRIFSIPTGSVTTLFSMDSVPGAGTFVTSSVKYVRVTNNSTLFPVKLIVSSSTEAMSYLISAGSSYMISTSKMTGSVSVSTSSFNFSDIQSVKAQPSGSAASIEYYIATT